MMKSPSCQRRLAVPCHGFTLLEMLVTLALVASVSALIWQALASVARIEHRLAESALFSTESALRTEWVRQALSGLANGPQGDALVTRGDDSRLLAYTTRPPWPGTLGPEPMALRLQMQAGITTLTGQRIRVDASADPGQEPVAEGPSWPLMSWPGTGRFRYLDHEGNWLERWPGALDSAANDVPAPRLPRAVALVGVPDGALLVAVSAGDNPMLSRREVEK